MFGLGAGELLVIGVVALIFIGPKKLPELARGLGKGIREFQKAKTDLMTEVDKESISQEIKETVSDVKGAANDGPHYVDEHSKDHAPNKSLDSDSESPAKPEVVEPEVVAKSENSVEKPAEKPAGESVTKTS